MSERENTRRGERFSEGERRGVESGEMTDGGRKVWEKEIKREKAKSQFEERREEEERGDERHR